jgi:hypothetical protein
MAVFNMGTYHLNVHHFELISSHFRSLSEKSGAQSHNRFIVAPALLAEHRIVLYEIELYGKFHWRQPQNKSRVMVGILGVGAGSRKTGSPE